MKTLEVVVEVLDVQPWEVDYDIFQDFGDYSDSFLVGIGDNVALCSKVEVILNVIADTLSDDDDLCGLYRGFWPLSNVEKLSRRHLRRVSCRPRAGAP